MLYTVDDIPQLRRNVWICRQLRQDATRSRDWHYEIFAEGQLRLAQRRYRSAVRWLRCSH